MSDSRPPRPLTPAEQDDVLKTAVQLQEQERTAERTSDEMKAMAEAGREIGLEPSHLAEAEALVRMEREGKAVAEADKRCDRRRFLIGSVVVAVAVLVMAGIHLLPRLLIPPPRGAPGTTSTKALPIEARFDPIDWRLEISPGSVAQVRYQDGVADVGIDTLAPMGDGRYWVNLESDHHPRWGGLGTVTFAVRGEGLPNVRLYLENPTERWRGPSVPVTSTWQTHALPLALFEHQRKEGGWSVTADAPPGDVKTVSFKLGWFVNAPGARGHVELRDLHAE